MNINPNITREVLEKLYIDEKLSTVAIAEKIGASTSAISVALRRFGIPTRSISEAFKIRDHFTQDIDWEKEKIEYESGKNIESIAQKLDCSISTAAAHLKDIGTKIRPGGARLINVDWPKYITEHQNGRTIESIADELSCNPNIVRLHFQKHGFKLQKYTKIDINAVKELRDKKVPVRKIAEQLNASMSGIHNVVRSIKVNKMNNTSTQYPKTYMANWAELAKKYTAGARLQDIAQEVGCSISVAAERLRSVGVVIRKRGSGMQPNKIALDIELAIQMNKDGMNLVKIAEKFGVSKQLLYQRIKRTGYTMVFYRLPKDQFSRYRSGKKAAIARAIEADKCRICGESRAIDLCHIQAEVDGGPLIPDNLIPLCPTCHKLFDRGELRPAELKNIQEYLSHAAELGYINKHYHV